MDDPPPTGRKLSLEWMCDDTPTTENSATYVKIVGSYTCCSRSLDAMKRTLKDKFYVWAGNRSLDWLEKLPSFQQGGIAKRQHVRERQREEAQEAHEATKLPAGVSVDFLCFRLVEIYQIEDTEHLRRGVRKLLPFVEGIFWHSDFSDVFARRSSALHAGAGWNLGYLVRKKNYFPSTDMRVLPSLPEEVSVIELWLYQVFPSLFAITFDVYLSESATEMLMRVHDKKRLSSIRFLKLFPWGAQASSLVGENTSERAIKHEVLEWTDKLRRRVEECIEPYLQGYFSERSSKGRSKLPAIEIIAVKGVPNEPDEPNQWLTNSRQWLSSLGFGHDFLVYKSGTLMHFDPADDSPYGRTVQRFVPLWESYLPTVSPHDPGPEREAIAHHMRYMLDDLLPIFVISQYLQSIQSKIEELRQASFRKMKPGWKLIGRMNTYLRLHDTIQRQSMLLDRISMEYEQQKRYIERETDQAVSELKIDNHTFGRSLGETLSERLLTSVTHGIEFLKTHLGFVTESFAEHLATKNMKVMYQLQRRMLWLTWVVTIATLLAVAAGWESIKAFTSDLMKLLNR